MTSHADLPGRRATTNHREVPGAPARSVPAGSGPARSDRARSESTGSGTAESESARSGTAESGTVGTLADRQAALVAALVAGAPLPPGFDDRLVGVARSALLGKRAGEVARHWPLLAAGLGTRWPAIFAAWAAARPTLGPLRDGWDLARQLATEAALPAPAVEELTIRETRWRYDGRTPPRRRRLPTVRRTGGTVVVQFAGRIRIWSRRR